MDMENEYDSTKNEPGSLIEVLISNKKTSNLERKIGKRKRKHSQRNSGSSDDEPPKQLLRRSPNCSPQSLYGESERNLQNSLIFISDTLPNFSPNCQKYEREPVNNEELFSDNPSENSLVNEESTIIDNSASNTSDNFISFRNLHQSLHDTALLQDQPNLLDNSHASSGKDSCFKPSDIFCNLVHSSNNNDAKEFACERRIFQPNVPLDVLSEDKSNFSGVRSVFESEGKLKDSTGQTKTWSIHQTKDKDVFKNLSDQDNQNCDDWDKFLEKWEGTDFISDSTSETHPELKNIEELKECLASSSTSKGSKKETSNSTPCVPFNGQTKKRLNNAESSETVTSLFKFSSSDEEHGSNQKLVLPSFENELEIIVQPISSDISEANTSSRLKEFIKNTKLKLLEDCPIPPFVEKLISLDSESLPNRMNDSSLYSDSFKILQGGTKNTINLFKNQICAEENISCSTNDSNEIEELTGRDGDPSVFGGDVEMIS